GFATQSYKENGRGGFLAQAIGTSMLQVPNIIKNPLILIPPTVAGIMLVPFATVWLKMTNNAAGACIETSGFVGQIMACETMRFNFHVLISIIILHIIALAVISWVLMAYFKKRNWVKSADLIIHYE